MSASNLEPCPGCQEKLPISNGPVHRYIGASPACWWIFSSMVNAGEPSLAPHSMTALLTDAYAAQHPGVPSAQSIQSVAVHLLVLYGVFVRKASPDQALWIRQQAVAGSPAARHTRFTWLAPPNFTDSLTITRVAQAPTPAARTMLGVEYIEQVWGLWAKNHLAQLEYWFDRYILANMQKR